MLQRIWTVSTLLSFSRIALLAPIAYFLFSDIPNNRLWVGGVIIVAALTDFFDGYIARRLHQVTDFGKIIDPVADKITIGVAAILLVVAGMVPLWYVVVVIARDILILMGGLYIKSKKNIITQSNWPGKLAVSFIALVLLLSVLGISGLEGFQQVMIWVSIVMMSVSLFIYVRRLFVGNTLARKGNG